MEIRPPISKVKANYKKQKVLDYQGNPVIEALPDILSEEDIFRKMCNYPPFYPEEKEFENHFRYHCIRRIKQYFQPLNIHKSLEQRFSILIREGLIGRNPMNKEYAAFLQQNYQSIKNGQYDMTYRDPRSTATSFSIIGPSGTGKSTSVEKVLSTYPQVIKHETLFCLNQITWLKIECPNLGSLKGLCVNFFSEVDRVLGETNYLNDYGSNRNSVETMLGQMAHIAYRHCLGCLIIDEIQQLDRAKSGGDRNMMDFFQSLVNKVNIPLIFIGTKKAQNVLSKEFRIARRTSSLGIIPWEPLANDGEWEFFITGMWKYQWTQKDTKLTREFLDVLYEESLGIIDVVKTLFMIAQGRAIESGKEEISIPLIKSVMKHELAPIRAALQEIKSGKKISDYDDLDPIDFDAFFNQKMTSTVGNQQIEQQETSQMGQNNSNREELLEQIVLDLLLHDVNPKTAESIANQVIKMYGGTKPFSFMLKEAIKIAISSESEVAVTKNNSIKKDVRKAILPESEDISAIALSGKEKGQTADQALREKGFIKPLDEDFPI